MEKLSGRDANGNKFVIGDKVLLPKPVEGDKHKKEGVGHVSKFHDSKKITVVMDDDIVEITQDRVESLPELI